MGSEDKPKLTAAHVRALRDLEQELSAYANREHGAFKDRTDAMRALLASGLLDGIEDEEAYNKAVAAWRASHDVVLSGFAHNCFRAGWQARAALDGEVR